MPDPALPHPPCLSPAWCHLSSVSLKRGHDYHVSICKGPRWDSEPDPWRRQQGADSGAHMLRWWALQPWVFSLQSLTAECYASLGPGCLPVTGLLPTVPPPASHSGSWRSLVHPARVAATSCHSRARQRGMFPSPGFIGPQMPYIPGAGRERKLL